MSWFRSNPEYIPPYTQADVYRHAAEVIVRDGKHEGAIVGRPNGAHAEESCEAVADTSLPVCAIGACFRAEYELNGNKFPKDILDEAEAGFFEWDRYGFRVQVEGHYLGRRVQLWTANDTKGVSAEDVALILKQHAEDIDNKPTDISGL